MCSLNKIRVMNITKTPAMLKRNPLSRKEKNVMKVVFYVSLPTCKGLRNSLGFGVWGLGFGVWGLGFGVWGLGFGVWEYFSVCHAGRGVSRRPAEIPKI
ncbi:hypothetical protein DJ549_14305 [Klebsiella grimontii]|nr:hypothetical protein DJ549_14305 [Klebsiella grimontii]